ncbi:MAG: DcaP family trimeric outer membrane transporter [Bacteroidota bacterium]
MKSLPTVLIVMLFLPVLMMGQEEDDKVDLKVYGFVRMNATLDFQEMGNSDLFRPANIKMPGAADNYPHLYMSAKQSRFGIKMQRKIDGEILKTRIEADFHSSSNQTGGLVRLRHAYLQYKGFTIGQAWSTFYDIQARPKIVDFEGANSATLNRPPLIRYDLPIDKHTLSIALEHPTEQITVNDQIKLKKQLAPYMVAAMKWRLDDKKSFIKVAAIARQLRYEVPIESDAELMQNQNLLVGGAMSSGRIQVNKQDFFKYQLIGGKGLARYVRGVRGLGYDAICSPGCNQLDAIGIYGGFLAYEKRWAKQWTSTMVLGGINVERMPSFTEDDMDYCLYGSANVFYEVNTAFQIGVEYLYGERTNLSGITGNANRLQMVAQMRFN